MVWITLGDLTKLLVARRILRSVDKRYRLGCRFTNVSARQAIPYTDFPMERIDLYACWDTEHWVIMLPSEYWPIQAQTGCCEIRIGPTVTFEHLGLIRHVLQFWHNWFGHGFERGLGHDRSSSSTYLFFNPAGNRLNWSKFICVGLVVLFWISSRTGLLSFKQFRYFMHQSRSSKWYWGEALTICVWLFLEWCKIYE